MAITPSASDYKGTFGNGYAFTGHSTKDNATEWAQAVETATETLQTDVDALEAVAITQKGGTVAVAGAALVIPVTHSSVTKTTGGAEALSLANGTAGQVLNISITAASGDGTLTPATATGWATCVFTAAGDNLALMYVDDTVGWIVLGTAGVLAPPVLSA